MDCYYSSGNAPHVSDQYPYEIFHDNANIPPLHQNDITIIDSLQKAEIFNHHFKSFFTRENLDFPSKGPSSHPTIENVTISTTGILKLLNKLNIYKACGPDGVHYFTERTGPIPHTI